jgi:hypothetical protein
VPTSDHSRDKARQDETESTERVSEAVARARKHAYAAIAEALASAGALLDASSLVLGGDMAARNPLLGPIARILEGLRAEFDDSSTTGEVAALLRAVADALDVEIARWETRAETDPDARAVLRAFLGLRELLWEFGIRREPEAEKSGETSTRSARKKGHSASTRRKQPRVQRVTIE